MINDGGPAFPIGSGDMRDPVGMSLRDWFAGQFLLGALQSPARMNGKASNTADEYSEMAYIYADSMIAQRTKEPK